MNVQLENLPNCLASLRVEVPAEKVSAEWSAIAGQYAKQVRLPGYRPGKAPKAIVEAKFKKEIREEIESRLVSEGVRAAAKENEVRVLSINNVEDFIIADDKSASFSATVTTEPAFELPEYKGIALDVESAEVTDADVDSSLQRLREESADFVDVEDRAVEKDDFAVINYSATFEGQPLHEAIPAVGKQLSEGIDFWIKLTDEAFLPGFSEKLIGLKPNESREFDVELPSDFVVADAAGKTLHYSVTLLSIKGQTLPELNDEFAGTIVEGKTLEDLRTLARESLAQERTRSIEGKKRNDIVEFLNEKVECELPENLVRSETYRILTSLIEENQQRGVPEEVIKANQAQLLATATGSARQRVKSSFILLRIAEKEGLSVSRQELDGQIRYLAMRYNRPVEKLIKELQKENAIERIHEDILISKTLDFLLSNASVAEKGTAEAPVEEAVAAAVEEKQDA